MSTDKRIFGGNPSKKALDFLDGLQNARKSSFSPNQSIEPSGFYLGDKTPFVRMWTATEIKAGCSAVYFTPNGNGATSKAAITSQDDIETLFVHNAHGSNVVDCEVFIATL